MIYCEEQVSKSIDCDLGSFIKCMVHYNHPLFKKYVISNSISNVRETLPFSRLTNNVFMIQITTLMLLALFLDMTEEEFCIKRKTES